MVIFVLPTGEEGYLSWEKFPYSALSKTYNTDQQTPDSAGTATAFMTGVKSKAGEIFLNTALHNSAFNNNNNYYYNNKFVFALVPELTAQLTYKYAILGLC